MALLATAHFAVIIGAVRHGPVTQELNENLWSRTIELTSMSVRTRYNTPPKDLSVKWLPKFRNWHFSVMALV